MRLLIVALFTTGGVAVWIDNPYKELAAITELIDSEHEVQPGDEVIGELPPDLRKLFTLWRLYAEKPRQLSGPEGMCLDLDQRALILDWLWVEVKTLFPSLAMTNLLDFMEIQICQGWKVVTRQRVQLSAISA